MEQAYKGHEFEALKMRYEDQVELLREITKLDLQIFSGYLTLQIALGGWLIAHPLQSLMMQIGMLLIDAALAAIAGYLHYSHFHRRREAVDTIKNLNRALGFTEQGIGKG